MGEKQYDCIVIGSGAGLNVASAAADGWNWKVAVMEDGPLGGTCLNRGCIPSKIIIHAADVAEEIRGSERYGIRAKIEYVDFAKVTGRATSYVDHDSRQMEDGLRRHPRIDLYKTRGEFIDAKTLRIGSDTIRSDKILIAAGARPTIPPIEGLKETDHITSTEALRLTKQPRSMIILGGGYIAAELGHFYGALGTEVTIVERGTSLLSRDDADISRTFTDLFSKKYRILLGQTATRVEQASDGMKVVYLEGPNGKRRVEGDALLVAVGITPNSDTLNLQDAGVKTNERGHIEVNEYMETSVPGIWALGDIVGKAPFRHAANYESEHVIANLRGSHKHAVDYSVMPHAIFSSPQVAGVGLTEQEAKEKGVSYDVRRFHYRQTAMGKALEEEHGFVKYLVDPGEDTIIGCHVVGPHASILIHEVVVVMRAGGSASMIRNAIHVHPALSEVLQWGL